MMSPTRTKPLMGDPCNRCGLCCLAGPCGAARRILGQTEGPCTVLLADGLGGYVCGMGLLSEKPGFKEAVAIATGAGIGCDMTSTVDDLRARPARIDKMVQAARSARRAASPQAERLLRRMGLSPP